MASAWQSGPLLIGIAAFLFSCQSLCIKLLGGRIPTPQVVLYPALVCFGLTAAVAHVYGLQVRSPSWRITCLTLLRGLLGAASVTCFYASVRLLPLQVWLCTEWRGEGGGAGRGASPHAER